MGSLEGKKVVEKMTFQRSLNPQPSLAKIPYLRFLDQDLSLQHLYTRINVLKQKTSF